MLSYEERRAKMGDTKKQNEDNVTLNLVQTNYREHQTMKLSEPEKWPAVVRLFLFPRKLGIQQSFWFRLASFVVLVSLSVPIFFKNDKAWVVDFLHSINLLVHEAGHVVFQITGNRVIISMGGSLFQCIVPLIFCFALWIKPRDLFGASIGLWWSFENLMDVVPYVADALPMKLPLINGVTGAGSPYGFHDWNYVLCELGYIIYYQEIAQTLATIAKVGIAVSILWAAWSLWYYWFVQRLMVKDQIYD
jgi:hypothetical protein